MPVHTDQPGDCPSQASLRIALVNNMPGSAAAENQFISVLERASSGIEISLSFYTLPELAASLSGFTDSISNRHYQSTDVLCALPPQAAPDALLVTGREPTTADLREEPYWKSFTALVEWARGRTLSTVWSCLAAHAAVLHLDGIVRHRNFEKHCGIFLCRQPLSPHPPHPLSIEPLPRWYVPHSRWNSLAEHDLLAAGYRLLTLTMDGEVDAFTRPNTAQDESMFVFFQGHPEYGTYTLLREYRRDVGRFLAGASQSHPSLPVHYFDGSTEDRLRLLQGRAAAGQKDGIEPALSTALESAHIENRWAEPAASLYRRWLHFLLAEKARRRGRVPVGVLSNVDRAARSALL